MDNIPYITDEVFGLNIPKEIAGIPNKILVSKNTWTNRSDYNSKRKELASKFIQNFEKYKNYVDKTVIEAGPVI